MQGFEAADFFGQEQVQAAVDALVYVAEDISSPPNDRVRAAETLLEYGVKPPWFTSPTASAVDE